MYTNNNVNETKLIMSRKKIIKIAMYNSLGKLKGNDYFFALK